MSLHHADEELGRLETRLRRRSWLAAIGAIAVAWALLRTPASIAMRAGDDDVRFDLAGLRLRGRSAAFQTGAADGAAIRVDSPVVAISFADRGVRDAHLRVDDGERQWVRAEDGDTSFLLEIGGEAPSLQGAEMPWFQYERDGMTPRVHESAPPRAATPLLGGPR